MPRRPQLAVMACYGHWIGKTWNPENNMVTAKQSTFYMQWYTPKNISKSILCWLLRKCVRRQYLIIESSRNPPVKHWPIKLRDFCHGSHVIAATHHCNLEYGMCILASICLSYKTRKFILMTQSTMITVSYLHTSVRVFLYMVFFRLILSYEINYKRLVLVSPDS